jgi:hypothetical protein
MRFSQDGQRLWNTWAAHNAPPNGLPENPHEWPEEAMIKGALLGTIEDMYSAVIMYAAKEWAEAMEGDLTDGTSVEDVAAPSFNVINDSLTPWNLTALQYSACVAVLSGSWEHGETLRRWHNLATQVGTEGEEANEKGGILNAGIIEEQP